jgi:hypothetical protein
MEETNSLQKTVRLAGLFWFLGAATASFGLVYIRPKLIVFADAAATANNIMDNEFLFRMGIVCSLLGQIFLVFFGLAAYRLFKGVDKTWARLFLTFVLMSSGIAIVNSLNNIAALVVLSRADYLNAFGQEQLNALMMIFLKLNNFGVGLAELFLSPYLFALGLLFIKSRFVPKILGVLLITSSCGFLINTFTKILIPQFYPVTFTQVAMLGGSLVLPATLWFLIKGVKEQPQRRRI